MTDVRIALISATPLAIAPAAAAIAQAFPGGTVWNLLDDRLLADAQEQGGISPELAGRMDRLIETALAGGADGVLLTCSQYGMRADVRDPAADGVAVLSPDGAMFAEAVARRPARLLLVASLDSAAADSSARLAAAFAAAGAETDVSTLVVPAAARPMEPSELIRVLGDAVAEAGADHDLVVLAQFSLAPAATDVAERIGVPVLEAPGAAARRLMVEIEDRSR